MICRHLRSLSGLFDDVIVVVSYMGDAVASAVERCGYSASIVSQERELGTGHAVAVAMEHGGPGLYTILYSDLFLNRGNYEIVSSMKAPSVAVVKSGEAHRYGLVRLRDGVLAGVQEKPSGARKGLVFAGVMRLPWDFIDYFKRLKPSARGELEATEALNAASRDHEIPVVELEEGGWRDVGRPWDLLIANREALESEVGEPSVRGDVSGLAHLEGPVVVEEGAVVKPYTVIEGPAYIGRGSRIFSAQIRPGCSIGEVCRIGGEVEASIFHPYSNKRHYGYIGHSYIGEWINLGAGTTNSNLKNTYGEIRVTINNTRINTGRIFVGCFMGDHVKTAIGTLVFSGKRIGVASHLYGLIKKDIPSFTSCFNDEMTEIYLDSAVETARRMMRRRGKELSRSYEEMLRSLFELTADERRLSNVRRGALPV
jgi:bifunctional UDP-N-acetylglucosamine pyrophosphorylase/glucosamine-1-phosphate N-acetyltransferase